MLSTPFTDGIHEQETEELLTIKFLHVLITFLFWKKVTLPLPVVVAVIDVSVLKVAGVAGAGKSIVPTPISVPNKEKFN